MQTMKNILFITFLIFCLGIKAQRYSLSLEQHIATQDWLLIDTIGKNQSADMIVQDSKGYIYIGTNKEPLFNQGKQQILKIDTAGRVIWRYYLTAPKSFASLKKILIDKDDNILLLTVENGVSCIKKIDSETKEEVWTHFANQYTDYFDIATDKEGNIYGTGWEYSRPNVSPAFVEKIAPTGEKLWLSVYEINVPDTVYIVLYGNKIEIAPDNSIYIAAFEGGVNQQTVFKYNPDGLLAWRSSYHYAATAGMEFYVVDMKIDQDNACYLSCSLDTAHVMGFRYPYPEDGLLLKFNANGGVEWDKAYIHENKMYMGRLAINDNNHLLLVGAIIQDSLQYGNRNGYIANISSSGNIIWEQRLSNTANTFFSDIVIANNYIYVMGNAYCCMNDVGGAITPTFSVDWYLTKLNLYGDIVWWTSENGSTHERDLPFGIVLSPDKESIYVAGWLEQRYGPYKVVTSAVAKYTNRKESLPFEVSFYPNPLNQAEEGNILLNLAQAEQVNLVFYNAIGQEVGKLVQDFAEGKHIIPWHFSPILATGMYFYRLSTPSQSATGKLIIIKK